MPDTLDLDARIAARIAARKARGIPEPYRPDALDSKIDARIKARRLAQPAGVNDGSAGGSSLFQGDEFDAKAEEAASLSPPGTPGNVLGVPFSAALAASLKQDDIERFAQQYPDAPAVKNWRSAREAETGGFPSYGESPTFAAERELRRVIAEHRQNPAGVMREPPPPTFTENLRGGFGRAVAGANPALARALGVDDLGPSGGVGGFVGSLAGGMADPVNLATVAAGPVAGLAGRAARAAGAGLGRALAAGGEDLAAPVVRALAPVLGARAAGSVGGAIAGAGGAASVAGTAEATKIPMEDWAADPVGSFLRVAKAMGMAGVGGGAAGGALGVLAAPGPRGAGVESAPGVGAGAGQRAMRGVAEAYRGAPRETMPNVPRGTEAEVAPSRLRHDDGAAPIPSSEGAGIIEPPGEGVRFETEGLTDTRPTTDRQPPTPVAEMSRADLLTEAERLGVAAGPKTATALRKRVEEARTAQSAAEVAPTESQTTPARPPEARVEPAPEVGSGSASGTRADTAGSGPSPASVREPAEMSKRELVDELKPPLPGGVSIDVGARHNVERAELMKLSREVLGRRVEQRRAATSRADSTKAARDAEYVRLTAVAESAGPTWYTALKREAEAAGVRMPPQTTRSESAGILANKIVERRGMEPAPPVREPWEMTREEFIHQQTKHWDEAVAQTEKMGGTPYFVVRTDLGNGDALYRAHDARSGKELIRASGPGARSRLNSNLHSRKGKYSNVVGGDIPATSEEVTGIDWVRRAEAEIYNNIQRRDIERALSEGRPVPPAVLAEYPELEGAVGAPAAPITDAQRGGAPKGPQKGTERAPAPATSAFKDIAAMRKRFPGGKVKEQADGSVVIDTPTGAVKYQQTADRAEWRAAQQPRKFKEADPRELGADVERLQASAKVAPDRTLTLEDASGIDKRIGPNKVDRAKGIAKLKAFVRTVPEFKIDPTFTVVGDGVVRFKDGGTYKFFAEAIGLDIGDAKPGERIRLNLDDVAAAKQGKHVLRVAEAEATPTPKGSGSSSAMASPPRSLGAPPGAPTRPMRIAPAPLKGEVKPIREMILKIQDTVGKVRAGKSSRGSIGTYYPGSSKTVIRFTNDLDTAAHEIAHRLDDLYGIVAQWATPKGYNKAGAKIPQKSPFDTELRDTIFQQTIRDGYSVVQKRAEGVAEFIRAWIVNPDEAKAEAPKFSAFFEQQVPANVLKDLRAFGDDIRRWAGSSNIERTMSNVEVGLTAPGLVQRVKESMESEGVGGSVIDKMSAAVNDALAPVWKGVALAKELRGLKDILPSRDPQTRLRLFAGFDRKAMDVLNHGPVDFRGERVKGLGGVDWLLEPLDQTNRKSLEADFKATIAFGLSERVGERVGILRDAVQTTKDLAKEIANLKAQIQAAPPGSVVMGSSGKPLQQEIRELAQEIRATMKKVGYDGPMRGFEQWTEDRAQRMSGTGGGIYSDELVAREALKELNADPKRLARVKEAAKRYRAWSDAVLEYMLDGGRISPEQAKAIRENNNRYFAMKRLSEEIDPTLFSSGSRKLASVGQPIKRFLGSTKTIENPYVSLLEQTYAMMRETDRNAGLADFTALLEKPRGMYQGKPIDFDQIGSKAKTGDPDAITVYQNGKAEKWQFAPAIHKALKDWGINNTPNWLVRAAMWPAKIVRATVTLAPQFAIRQQIRDPLSRGVTSRSGSKPWGHLYFATPAGAGEFRSLLSEFERHGGGLFGHQVIGRDAYYGRMREAVKKAAGERSIFSFPRNVARGYQRFMELGETVGRLAEYRKAFEQGKAKGWSDQDAGMYAALQARDIQDFAVAGTVTRAINQFVPFTSAAARGIARTLTAVREQPGTTAARWLAYVGSLELMNYAWNYYQGEEDQLRALSPYRRDFFWNYHLGDGLWLTIPKPYELGVAGSGVSRAIEFARGNKGAFDGFPQSIGMAASPFGVGDLVGPYKALAEVITNHDLFTGREIVPTWDRFGKSAKPPGERKGEKFASGVGQLIGKALGVDARYVDQFIEGQLGHAGRLITSPNAQDAGERLSGVLYRQRERKAPAANPMR